MITVRNTIYIYIYGYKFNRKMIYYIYQTESIYNKSLFVESMCTVHTHSFPIVMIFDANGLVRRDSN